MVEYFENISWQLLDISILVVASAPILLCIHNKGWEALNLKTILFANVYMIHLFR